jgi:DNA-binding NarL/FixJ family response regulator
METAGTIVHLGILCDHASFRQALGRILGSEPWIELVAELDSERGTKSPASPAGIDVLVFVASGTCRYVEASLRQLQNLTLRLKILLLTLDDDDKLAMLALQTGVLGVLSKKAQLDELLRAIRQVHAGERYLSAPIQHFFSQRYVRHRLLENAEEHLTKRETEILRLLALGSNHHEIAHKLFVSIKTIDTHRSNLLRKLKLRNNADITRFAIRNGLIDVSEEC